MGRHGATAMLFSANRISPRPPVVCACYFCRPKQWGDTIYYRHSKSQFPPHKIITLKLSNNNSTKRYVISIYSIDIIPGPGRHTAREKEKENERKQIYIYSHIINQFFFLHQHAARWTRKMACAN